MCEDGVDRSSDVADEDVALERLLELRCIGSVLLDGRVDVLVRGGPVELGESSLEALETLSGDVMGHDSSEERSSSDEAVSSESEVDT